MVDHHDIAYGLQCVYRVNVTMHDAGRLQARPVMVAPDIKRFFKSTPLFNINKYDQNW